MMTFGVVKKISFVLILVLSVFSINSVNAATPTKGAILIADQVSVNGTKAVVPIRIKDVQGLASGSFEITAPSSYNSIYYDSITFSENFNGDEGGNFWSSAQPVNYGNVLVNFSAVNGKEINISSDVICYVTYQIKPNTYKGNYLDIKFTKLNLQDAKGVKKPVNIFDGKVTKGLALGDVFGNDKVTVASASKILQHSGGLNIITNSDYRNAGDVNADENLDSLDALKILKVIAGVDEDYFTIKNVKLPDGYKDTTYSYTFEALYGRAPYKWKATGIPTGFKIDEKTGKLEGKIAKPNDKYDITVEVTDGIGNTSKQIFTLYFR